MVILKQKRFNELLHSIEGINPNTLATRLKEMKKSNLIEKKVFNETPIRIEYSLTTKGAALRPILEEMAKLSNFQAILATHSPQIIGDRWDLTTELKGPNGA